ncbi:hypothetical protein, partial [Salipiger mucosus]|uniref:hypothetical protein n=1 Tax=Salipiger mucosus TaxID=263378 RepID=UPI000564F9B2
MSALRSLFESVFLRAAALLAVSTLVVAGIMAWQSSTLIGDVARQGVLRLAGKSVSVEAEALVDHMRFNAAERIAAQVEIGLRAGGDDLNAIVVVGADGAMQAEAGDTAATGAELAGLAGRALSERGVATERGGLWIAAPVWREGMAAPVGAVAMAWSDAAALARV